MSLRIGETGKIIRVAAGLDMSPNTELTLDFVLPDNTVITKTKTAGEVVLGIGITDPDLGPLPANTYVDYDIEPGFLVQSGAWTVQLTYEDTAATQNDKFIGDPAPFTVKTLEEQ